MPEERGAGRESWCVGPHRGGSPWTDRAYSDGTWLESARQSQVSVSDMESWNPRTEVFKGRQLDQGQPNDLGCCCGKQNPGPPRGLLSRASGTARHLHSLLITR